MLYRGKNLEEVLQEASEKEFTAKEDLLYYIVKQDEELTEIEVYTIVDVIEFARNYIVEGINALGFEARVNPTLKDGIINLKIESDRNPILIGKNGTSLQALNELARIAVSNHFHKRFRILLNVSDYKEEKYAKISLFAKRIAHEVQKTKVNVLLDPMTADERRVIHNALTGMPNIRTESSGFGKNRQINIIYVEDNKKEEE